MRRTVFRFQLVAESSVPTEFMDELRRVAGVVEVAFNAGELSVTAEFLDGGAARKMHRRLVLMLTNGGINIRGMATNLTEVFG